MLPCMAFVSLRTFGVDQKRRHSETREVIVECGSAEG